MALTLESGLQDALADEIGAYVDAGTAPELVFETAGDVDVARAVQRNAGRVVMAAPLDVGCP